MTGFVYRWTNNINGRWYVGSRKGTPDDGYRHSSQIVKAAEQKYGVENFTREILFMGDYENDQIREVVEANYLREEDAANNPMSYNQSNITGPNCFSIEHRRKLSEAKLGKKLSIAHRKAQGDGRRGKPFTEERCQNISLAKMGHVVSSDTKAKISKTLTGRKLSPERCNAISKGKKGIPDRKVSCPHCYKIGGITGMHRYHFDNCKTLTT